MRLKMGVCLHDGVQDRTGNMAEASLQYQPKHDDTEHQRMNVSGQRREERQSQLQIRGSHSP